MEGGLDMSSNSKDLRIDLQLFNRLAYLFDKPCSPKRWLVQYSEDFGKWKDLSICDATKLLRTTEDLLELRALSLFSIVYEIYFEPLVGRLARTLQNLPNEYWDVYLVLGIYKSPACPKDVEDSLRVWLANNPKECALDFLVAAEYLKDPADKNLQVNGCCNFLVHNGISLERDLGVLKRLIDYESDSFDFCKNLKYLTKKLPKENSKISKFFRAIGLNYDDVVVLTGILQQNSYSVSKEFKETLRAVLLRTLRTWSDIDKNLLRWCINSSVSRSCVMNMDNWAWLVTNGFSNCLRLNLNSDLWIEVWETSEPFDRQVMLCESLLNLSDESLRDFWNNHKSKILEIFSFFSEGRLQLFKRLVDAQCVIDVGDAVIDVYWANIFSTWTSKASYDFLQYVDDIYGKLSPQYCKLLEGILSVDFDFLDTNERENLFAALDDFVFRYKTDSYKDFIVMNSKICKKAKQILDESRGGSDNE